MALPVETRRTLDERDRGWRVQFGMRASAAFLSLIGILIFAVTTKMSKDNYGGNDWVDGFPIAPLLISLLYNLFLIFATIYYRNGRPIHPGWSVTADLFVWGLGVPAILFSVGEGWFWYWQPVVIDFDGFIPCDEFNFWSHACNPMIYDLGRMEIAANVFLGLVIILHKVLFIWACIKTHRWRMQKKRERTERRNIELQYHRHPEEHASNQPPAYTPRTENEDDLRSPVSPVSPTSQDEAAVKYA